MRKEVALLNRAIAIVLLVQLALLACFAGAFEPTTGSSVLCVGASARTPVRSRLQRD